MKRLKAPGRREGRGEEEGGVEAVEVGGIEGVALQSGNQQAYHSINQRQTLSRSTGLPNQSIHQSINQYSSNRHND